jgi:hypothetical protein
MKQGNELKSLEIARKAVQFDRSSEPVLQWKQFRDVLQHRSSSLVLQETGANVSVCGN